MKGFTLIEIMVVLAILGVLSAIALPVYSSYKASANDTVAASDARNSIAAFKMSRVGD